MKAFILVVLICFTSHSDGKSQLSKRNSAADGSLIIGGKPTDIKEIPFLVVVMVSSDGTDFYSLCGGTILNPKYVLTAANCLKDAPKNISVGVGSSKLNNGTKYYTRNYTINPNYNADTEEYNSGLVILETPINLDGVTAKAVVLAKEGSKVNPGSVISLAGWGTQSETEIPNDNLVLREVKIPVIPQELCKKAYAIRTKLNISDNVFCAGDLVKGGNYGCRGDLGDPALLNGEQVGISSSGVWCGHAESPGTYTLVASIRPWLKIVAGV